MEVGIGQSAKGEQDVRLLTGHGADFEDLAGPGTLWAPKRTLARHGQNGRIGPGALVGADRPKVGKVRVV